jgi:methyltransferase (TIGR00027 family)
MHTDRASLTAENNAAVRAFESMHSVEVRICHDPYARHFVSDGLQMATDLQSALAGQISDWEDRFPGICGAIAVRTRFIDDCLAAAIAKGLQQLVILGAGYDTRAMRLEGLKKDVAVFELDHPATQKIKRQRCRSIQAVFPERIVFVPIRFGEQDLSRTLFDHGYRSAGKSFFIWEGMSYYLPAAVVEDTLAFIARHAAEGSSIVFDYVSPPVVHGVSRLVEATALTAALKHLGEPFVFGIDPGSLEQFLGSRGLALVQNLTAAGCRRKYLAGVNRHRRLSAMFFFAQAKVTHQRARQPE